MRAPENELRQGDCVDGLNALPKGCVDLVFADPPFNIGYSYDVYVDSLDQARYLDWSRQWIKAVHRVLKPDGSFWLAIGDENAAELKLAGQKIGFICRSWVVWYYTFGVNCVRKFTRSHAHLFYFVKNADRFTFNSDDLSNRIPSARQLVYADGRANPKGRLPDDTWLIPPAGMAAELSDDDLTPPFSGVVAGPDREQTWVLRPQDLSHRFSPEEDTWYFPRVAGTFKERAGFHGCQMPEQLLGRIIRLCSHPGELVLDPFAGSATTLRVAKKLGRRYLGFELSADYARFGRERLAEVCPGDPLDGSPEPTLSAPKTSESKSRFKSKYGSKSKSKLSRSEPAVATATTAPVRPGLADSDTDVPFQKASLFRGIIEAFSRTHQGFSPDRVVVDPVLNERFADECRKLGLLGDGRVWNTLLFRLRKAGKLVDYPTTAATTLSWEDCDDFQFASEIAYEAMLKKGAGSLDEILCDPVLAREFDDTARTFAPGFSSFQYRWAALKLRKQASLARARGSSLVPPARLSPAVTLGDVDQMSQLPDAPGIYLVSTAGAEPLYVGETVSLRRYLNVNFASRDPRPWLDHGKSEALTIQPFAPASPSSQLIAWRSCLMRQYNTPLNCRELRAAQ